MELFICLYVLLYVHFFEIKYQSINLSRNIPFTMPEGLETLGRLSALRPGNSPMTGKFPAQRPVTRSFNVFFDLRLNQHLSKQWRRRWFETPSGSLWRYCNMRLPGSNPGPLVSFQFKINSLCAATEVDATISHRRVPSLQWRHNVRDDPNHQPHDCLLNRWFGIRTQIKENIKAPRHWPLCGEFTGEQWISRDNGQ